MTGGIVSGRNKKGGRDYSDQTGWAADQNRRTGYRDPPRLEPPPPLGTAEQLEEKRRGMKARLEGGPYNGKAISRATLGAYQGENLGYAPMEIREYRGNQTGSIYKWDRRENEVHYSIFPSSANSPTPRSWRPHLP